MGIEDLPQATASAIALAEDHDIDLSTVEGTGTDGNITKQDVQRHIRDNDLVTDGSDGEDDDEQGEGAPAGPRLNRKKPMAECYGRTDGLKFIQAGKGFTAAGVYLGEVDPATNELVAS